MMIWRTSTSASHSESKGDWDGAIVEEREALRLNPNNELAHYDLGHALGDKGDWDGEIAEEREALRLNP
jgi:tetratricopeptide (TPR) repeat protein